MRLAYHVRRSTHRCERRSLTAYLRCGTCTQQRTGAPRCARAKSLELEGSRILADGSSIFQLVLPSADHY